MKLKTKKLFTIKFVNNLISTQAEENLGLEFKSAESLDFSNPKIAEENKIELSRDISAMANSSGGIIVYGIREHNHVAKSKSFIDGSIVTKERIEQIIQSRISRPVSNLEIIPIRENKNFAKTIYIVVIPESDDLPHMASDGVYYKRNNFNRIRAEEYEIRRDYLKFKKSVLDIDFPLINDLNGSFFKNGDKEFGHFMIWFHVRNTGAIFESNYKLVIQIPHSIYIPFFNIPNPMEKFKTHSNGPYHRFVIPAEQTIYPEEHLKIGGSFIVVKEENFDHIIKITLFYSGGSMDKDFTIREMFASQKEGKSYFKF